MNNKAKYLLPSILMTVFAVPTSFAQLEEVTVTAQKREESLQDVPISIMAVTGDSILEGGYSDMQEVSEFIPNLKMTDGFIGQEISIRGVGTANGNEAFEQAVAQFHDGVYYGRDNLGQNAFFDLERVEVVRGPAPIFAGQSATAGALSYYSRRPGEESEGYISASYGNDTELKLEGAWGGPVTDTLGVRIAGTFYDLGDTGYTDVQGRNAGTKENSAIRALAVWNPTDNFEASFKYEFHDVSQLGTPAEYTRCELRPEFSDANPGLGRGLPAACALDALVNGVDHTVRDGSFSTGGSQDAKLATLALNAALPAGSPFIYGGDGSADTTIINGFADGLTGSREMNEEEERDQQVQIAAAKLDYTWGEYLITSQTSYVSYDKNDWLDPDRSSFAIFSDERLEFFDQISQEFIISSPVDQFIAWQWAGYYQKHDLDTTINIFSGIPTPGGAISFGGTLAEESEWLSSYFSTTTNVTDYFRINAGVRYQHIQKDGVLTPTLAFFNVGDSEYSNATCPPGSTLINDRDISDGSRCIAPGASAQVGEVKSIEWLPEVGVQWDVAENTMVYVKYAEALKAGGFVMSPAPGGNLPDPFSFENESAEGIEVGIKARLLDNTLQINLSYYDTDFENLQLTFFRSEDATFITQNAGASHSTGVELDGKWAATDNFTLGFSGHIGEAEFDDYPNAECNSLEAKQSGLGPACTADRQGVSLAEAQDWSIALQPEYNMPYGKFNVRLGASIAITPSYTFETNQDPLSEVDSYTRIDLRAAISPAASEKWELALYVRDLTDEQVNQFDHTDFQSKSLDQTIFDANGEGRDRGRRVGIQGRLNF